jgi:hypothetical protein
MRGLRVLAAGALSACAAVAGIEELTYEPGVVSPVGGDSAAPDGGPPRDASTDVDPRVECSPRAPIFIADFQDAGSWMRNSASCSPSAPTFVSCPSGPCVELACRSLAFEAYNVLQIRAAAPLTPRVEAVFTARLPRPAPEHIFAQAIWWMARDDNLSFVLAGDDVVVRRAAAGREVARFTIDNRELHEIEVHMTVGAAIDAETAGAAIKIVVDGQSRVFLETINQAGPRVREPAFQFGPYIGGPVDASTTDRYETFAMWACD